MDLSNIIAPLFWRENAAQAKVVAFSCPADK